MKYTRQGVRDLSSIGPKKTVGIRLEMPPIEAMCDHKGELVESRCGYFMNCKRCGEQFDIHRW